MTPVPATARGSGLRIGRYVLTGRIGKGGMGRVYRGYDEALEREVAVKTLSPEGSLDDDHRRRFSIEAKAAARLQHPNIVTVYELGEDRGVPFIAMELLPGSDLEALLRAGEALLLPEALEIIVQVCRGLQFAHDRGIVHRDIKPSNIRVLDEGAVKIMDFGIAKLGASGITKSGMMVGTIHYMSPEQIRGQALDGRSDVFSVGVILYELLARRRPFVGEGATEILYKIVHEDPPPLPAEELGPVGEALHDVVFRALAKDPAQRWPSAAALADALARLLAGPLQAPPRAPEVEGELAQARAQVGQGAVQEGLARIEAVAARWPRSVEARRALRWATQEARRRQAPAGVEEEGGFPELEATFRSPQTAQEGVGAPAAAAVGADLPPTVLAGRTALTRLLPLPEAVAARPLLALGGVALVLALGTGSYFALRGPDAVTPVAAPSRSRTARPTPAPPAALASVSIVSEPAGARVTLDGAVVEGLTPLTVTVDPLRDHTVRVALAGHAPRDAQWAAGSIPAELRVALQPGGPAGKVSVTSAYPVDVIFRERLLARGQTAAEISLPPGKQTLTLAAPAYLLRASVEVEVRLDEVAQVQAPELGRINVRANPDNCKVFIDGAFIDYPPILDRPLATGDHVVTFKWPDAEAREQVTVERGRPAYVTGRKE